MGSNKTKRFPIRRHTRPPITPRAVEVYAAMKPLKARCTCGPDDPPSSCPACEEWYRLLMVVHTELRARPWEIPCICEDDGDGSRWAKTKHARYLALERAIAPKRHRHPAP
jgi:hypothetical protein